MFLAVTNQDIISHILERADARKANLRDGGTSVLLYRFQSTSAHKHLLMNTTTLGSERKMRSRSALNLRF
jgi:hypothetical protein